MTLPSLIKKIFLFPILFIVLIVLASLIQPMITLTDSPRNDMNCPLTNNFNQTQWDSMTQYQHTIYSTGCYALHWDVIAFIGMLSGLAMWGWFSK